MGLTTTLAVAAALAIAAAPAATAHSPSPGAAPWSYSGPNGPAHWGSLLPASDFAMCAPSVPHQSPIDVPQRALHAASGRSSVGDVARQAATRLTAEAVANGIHFDCPRRPADGVRDCGVAHFLGRTFHLENVHFHEGAEHTWGGGVRPLAEMHLEHGSEDGDAGIVIAVPLHDRHVRGLPRARKDKKHHHKDRCGHKNDNDDDNDDDDNDDDDDDDQGHNRIIERFVRAAEAGPGSHVRMRTRDWARLVDARSGYCTYVGSTTTPPCIAGETWLLATSRTHISVGQARRMLSAAAPGASSVARPVQPLEGRHVECTVGRRGKGTRRDH